MARTCDPSQCWVHSDGWIELYSGGQFWPLEARGDIRISDIGHALAAEARYTGHTRRYYSVAEHSVRVARIVQRRVSAIGNGLAYLAARYALLHDASEAYLSDIPRPLKVRPEMLFYREAEARLQRRIFDAFGLQFDEPDVVREVDKEIIGLEARKLFVTLSGSTEHLPAPPPEGEPDTWGWEPDVAEARFLQSFRRLWPSYFAEGGR